MLRTWVGAGPEYYLARHRMKKKKTLFNILSVFCYIAVGDFFPEETELDEIQRSRFKNLNQFECMHIMADLKEETLLFSIKYRSCDGLLIIYPDLNNIDVNPYLKEINVDSRNLYQFAMENLSTDCQNEVTQLKSDIELLANRVNISELNPEATKIYVFSFSSFSCVK